MLAGTDRVLFGMSSLLVPSGPAFFQFDSDHFARTRYFQRRVQGLHRSTQGLVIPFKFTAAVAT